MRILYFILLFTLTPLFSFAQGMDEKIDKAFQPIADFSLIQFSFKYLEFPLY